MRIAAFSMSEGREDWSTLVIGLACGRTLVRSKSPLADFHNPIADRGEAGARAVGATDEVMMSASPGRGGAKVRSAARAAS